MIFKLHYWFLASGANALGILMGVFLETYTDASTLEIGTLLMMMPFTGIIFRPIICSKADRDQAHQKYLIICLLVVAIGYMPFVIIPLLGPSVYVDHPRTCWWTLVVLKVIGDVAFGGVTLIGDSLAINYAERIGVEFSVYRVWGTISWLVFGIIIGQVNEIWFLPKYVPGFIILITSSLLDLLVVWLWPKEYFIMVPKENEPGKKREKEKSFTKSLLPRAIVWSHMKIKLRSLLTCSCMSVESFALKGKGRPLAIDGQSNADQFSNGLQLATIAKSSDNISQQEDPVRISKMVQLKLLLILLRRDPRICLYLIFFVCAGISIAPLSFFFMSLSTVCHENGTCDFSQLAGLLQVSMASAETLTFVIIRKLQDKIGRVNCCALAFLLCAIKYLFYGLFWYNINPHWTLLSECLHGITFGIYINQLAELGNKFSSEIKFIIPELYARNIIKSEAEAEAVKLALAATMQSVVACAMDGLGRGFGAPICGYILEHYSFQTLWMIIGVSCAFFFSVTLTISLLDSIFDFRLGLDLPEKDRKNSEPKGENTNIESDENTRQKTGYIAEKN